MENIFAQSQVDYNNSRQQALTAEN